MTIRDLLTDSELTMIETLFDHWLDTLPDATEATIADDSIENFAELLDVVGDYEQQRRTIDGLRDKFGLRGT